MPTRILFSFQVAALSYQALEMNGLECKLEGFDRDWYTVGRNSIINYSNLPYGSYTLRIKVPTAMASGTRRNVCSTSISVLLSISPPGRMLFIRYWRYVHWLL